MDLWRGRGRSRREKRGGGGGQGVLNPTLFQFLSVRSPHGLGGVGLGLWAGKSFA